MIELPAMLADQEASWGAIFEIHKALPYGWVLVGGQSVFLHAIERNAVTPRATIDADFVLDIRTYPRHLETFTRTLTELGFVSAGESMEGHQHRWTREQAVVDVLIPRFLGERADTRRGITGGTTIAAPAAQHAVSRAETVEVQAGARLGRVNRPTLIGCLIGKAGALAIDEPSKRKERHVTDFLTLASVLRVSDLRGVSYGPAERNHLKNMLGNLANKPEWQALVPDSHDGLERLSISLQPDSTES